MIEYLKGIGKYFFLMKKVFSLPSKKDVFINQIFNEFEKVGISSLSIVLIISFFVGGVVTIQQAINIEDPFIPKYLIGFVTRDALILEFSPTMIALILAGKVGSNIASEIGSMRISEQIDALEIMGINSASHLVLPKIIASIIFFPILVILSIFIGIFGGWIGGLSIGVSTADFVLGLQTEFTPFYVTYSLIKTITFAFLITSISAFYGFNTRGGALEVGKSSTTAVVNSSILILVFNFIITELLLT